MLIPVLIGISIFVFLLMYFTPGDPALLMLGEGAPPEQYAALRESMGLDDPVYVQYFRWLGNAVRGDLGRSLRSKKLVTTEILDRLPANSWLSRCHLCRGGWGAGGILSASNPTPGLTISYGGSFNRCRHARFLARHHAILIFRSPAGSRRLPNGAWSI